MIYRTEKNKKDVDIEDKNLVFYIGEVHQDILATFYPCFKRRNNERERKSN